MTRKKLSLMTDDDFKEMNEVTKRHRGMSNITFEDVYGKKTKEKVEQLLEEDDTSNE